MHGSMDGNDPRADAVITQGDLRRERLRFQNFSFTRSPNGQCVAQVELDWMDGHTTTGRATGQSSPMGDLRLSADAALHAIQTFVGGQMQFELLGVKALRAFDANIVIVSVAQKRPEGPMRLLGSFLAEEDQPRAAALAVLNATNRVLSHFLASR